MSCCPHCNGTGKLTAPAHAPSGHGFWFEQLGFTSPPDFQTLRGYVDGLGGVEYSAKLDAIRQGWKAVGPAPKIIEVPAE
jgi:hypothetical protein